MHPAASSEVTQRATGLPSASTVADPTTIGVPNGGAGMGGCMGPNEVIPVHTAMSPMCATGKPSMITIEIGPVGAMTPEGTNPSWVIGSGILAANPGGIIILLQINF